MTGPFDGNTFEPNEFDTAVPGHPEQMTDFLGKIPDEEAFIGMLQQMLNHMMQKRKSKQGSPEARMAFSAQKRSMNGSL